MRGRKPKPPARQMTEGDPSKHGKQKLAQRAAAEPKATSGLPACPRHLKGRARSAWKFWSDELEVMGLDRRPDAQALEGACRAYERAVKADLLLDRQGLTVEDKFVDDAGKIHILKIRKHPAVEISRGAWLLVKAFTSEFGIGGPATRTRLVIDEAPGDEEADLMKLLSQPRVKAPGSPLVQ